MKTVLNGTIIDATGNNPIENGMIVIDGKSLEYVGKKEEKYPLPFNVEVIDLKGKWIMPGMVEAHSHLAGYRSGNTLDWIITPHTIKVCQAVKDLEALLNAGFTSVRDMGGYGCDLKRAMDQKIIEGPRIFGANACISQTAGHSDVWTDFTPDFLERNDPSHLLADGKDECRKMARIQFRKGADFIKIMTTGGIMDTATKPYLSHYSVDEIKIFVEEAERQGTYVATHAENNEGVYNAVLGGVKSIEHGYLTDDRTLELMVEKQCFQVPTLSVMTNMLKESDALQPHVREKIKYVMEHAYESVSRAHKAGVPLATGCDFLSCPGWCEYGMNGQELSELVKVGLTPMEAIIAATKNGAEAILMGDRLGTLEPGKIADIIAIDENPLNHIECLKEPEHVVLVMKEGNIVKNLIMT